MIEREIVRELRLKLREYFPDLQSHLDKNIITKNDWKFFGIIQFNLIKCFTVTPEKAIRESKIQINKIVKFYEKETRIRKLSLKSKIFIDENNIKQDKLQKKFKYYYSHLEYWKMRKESKEMCFHYEIYLFLYYKWMNNYELDEENTYKLLIDLMGFCDYYATRYFDIDRLALERNILMSEMKISNHILIIIEDNNSNMNNNQFLGEAKAHLN
jgi:hypothetical protein